jgi:flavin-dependent dehydrogenase
MPRWFSRPGSLIFAFGRIFVCESVIDPLHDSRHTAFRIGGAGIAGLTAANALARAGEQVEVLEMKSRVGSSAGGHTEGVRNYLGRDGLEDLARFGVKVRPFSVANRVVRRSRRSISVVRGPSYYLVDRGGGPASLERQLLEQALDAGAQVRYKTKADPARLDIIATGAPREKINIFAAGYRFTREGSNLPDDEIHALFDNQVAPHGYLCVLPGPSWHSIYAVSWVQTPYAELLSKVDRALRFAWVSDIVGNGRRVGKIFGKGYYHPNPLEAVHENGALRVGEAAGIQDAVGGFGIRFAVASGALSAQALLQGLDYGSLLREEFRDDFEVGLKSRAWLDRATDEEYDGILQKLGPEVGVGDYASWRRVRFL